MGRLKSKNMSTAATADSMAVTVMLRTRRVERAMVVGSAVFAFVISIFLPGIMPNKFWKVGPSVLPGR